MSSATTDYKWEPKPHSFMCEFEINNAACTCAGTRWRQHGTSDDDVMYLQGLCTFFAAMQVPVAEIKHDHWSTSGAMMFSWINGKSFDDVRPMLLYAHPVTAPAAQPEKNIDPSALSRDADGEISLSDAIAALHSWYPRSREPDEGEDYAFDLVRTVTAAAKNADSAQQIRRLYTMQRDLLDDWHARAVAAGFDGVPSVLDRMRGLRPRGVDRELKDHEVGG